jgi:hypothetical protein
MSVDLAIRLVALVLGALATGGLMVNWVGLGRVVDGAIILKIKGHSYRAHCAGAKIETPAK